MQSAWMPLILVRGKMREKTGPPTLPPNWWNWSLVLVPVHGGGGEFKVTSAFAAEYGRIFSAWTTNLACRRLGRTAALY